MRGTLAREQLIELTDASKEKLEEEKTANRFFNHIIR